MLMRSRQLSLWRLTMGSKGERRPADVIGNAVHVMRIATAGICKTVLLRAQLFDQI